MSYYNLFIDDERKPKDVTWVNLPSVQWIIATSYEDFVRIISDNGLPEYISFDHDLGDSAYDECIRAYKNDNVINYDNITEKTGYDCAKWLAQYCVDKNLPLPVYFCHSMNGIGRTNIYSILESARKVINGT
jgi:hypothetical protein